MTPTEVAEVARFVVGRARGEVSISSEYLNNRTWLASQVKREREQISRNPRLEKAFIKRTV